MDAGDARTQHHVLVIGAGVVGLTSAWWLLEAGYRVSVLERDHTLAGAASLHNGGQLSYRYVSPLADAGVPLKAIRWLLQPDGPLRWRPEADLRQWRWLLQFLRHCNGASNRRTTATLLQLGELSRGALAQLALPPEDYAWRQAGKLVLYRTHAQFQAAAALAGGSRQPLSPSATVRLEPAVANIQDALAGAIYDEGEAVADCHAFCLALAARLRAHPRFDGMLAGDAHGFVMARGRVAALNSSLGPLRADQYVLAAGIRSRTLAASAGLYLPLYPLKGYSLSAPIRAGDLAPQISVTDFEHKTLYARIASQLRVAAMVDLVGEDHRIDARRIASLTSRARASMPAAADYAQATPWAGLRPATPDGAPILGATPYPNLWLNVGHGALGFTLACGSADLLAGRMRGKSTPIALDGLTLGR